MSRDYKDFCIETLADELAAAQARITVLENDINVYKLITFEAVAQASELRRENEMISSRASVHRTRTKMYREAA